jgi:hypothetical protein
MAAYGGHHLASSPLVNNIDAEAVKEQLRALGHEMPTQRIEDFLRSLYLGVASLSDDDEEEGQPGEESGSVSSIINFVPLTFHFTCTRAYHVSQVGRYSYITSSAYILELALHSKYVS